MTEPDNPFGVPGTEGASASCEPEVDEVAVQVGPVELGDVGRAGELGLVRLRQRPQRVPAPSSLLS